MGELTKEQKNFLAENGKVVIKACPGSGKTYTVAHKLLSYVDNWKYPHCGIAVLSFTNVASDEINEKTKSIHGSLDKLGYPHFIGTVDSFINEFIVLRYGHLITKGNIRPRITLHDNWKLQYRYWRKECYQRECINNIEQFYLDTKGKLYRGNSKVICSLGNAKMLPCQEYKKMLFEKGIIFQSETAFYAQKILSDYPQIAEAIAERFPIIIIDEVQDTSLNQMIVFDLLIKAGVQSMFLVGDPDQSIYEWRNASPDCMLQKMQDRNWKTIELTGNFRNSQNICNATSFFSASLQGKKYNIAMGKFKNEPQKPILLLTDNCSEEEIFNFFLDKCNKMGIEISPKNVAILTRGRIYSETNINELWKSKEIELFAEAAYEFKCGLRKKAYQNTYKASYYMIYNEDVEDNIINNNIRNYAGDDAWNDYILEILSAMPDIELAIADWVSKFSTHFCALSDKYNYTIHEAKNINNIFKIKRSDKNVPNFKRIPLKNYFEKKNEDKYTRSSIHGVKGESYDAVLLYIKSRNGRTITPNLLMKEKLNTELMHLAYVAMTRPRRLLMLAMPETKGIENCERFAQRFWEYTRI